MLIGLCGRKRCGKDTVADYLVQHYGFVKMTLADPLKSAIMAIFGLSHDQLYGESKDIIDPYWNMTPRHVLQYIGTECIREQFGKDHPHIGSNIWTMSLGKRLDALPGQNIVISDIRFANEAHLVREHNGIMMRIDRPSLTEMDAHVSENSYSDIRVDHILTNETLFELYRDTEKICSTYHIPCANITPQKINHVPVGFNGQTTDWSVSI
jgi:hypothetical protein